MNIDIEGFPEEANDLPNAKGVTESGNPGERWGSHEGRLGPGGKIWGMSQSPRPQIISPNKEDVYASVGVRVRTTWLIWGLWSHGRTKSLGNDRQNATHCVILT